MEWAEVLDKSLESQNDVLSFDEYMEHFKTDPLKRCRVTAQYLKDMFDYFETNAVGGYKLFAKEHSDTPPVYGQFSVQEAIYRNLTTFVDEGFNNRFILLVGPNGSAKTSLIKKIMKSAEEYSRTDEGAVYSFSWIFPIDNITKGHLGFSSDGSSSSKGKMPSYAHLEDKEISAILNSELRDHPLLLIPLESRQKLLDETFRDNQEALAKIKRTYFYTGDISKKNRMIFEALLTNYKGDYREVFKHIRVERYHINKRYSVSAVTIEPQMHVDAQLQQITMDKRLANLPPSLQSLNLFNMHGELVLANRGILEYSDLLKRPLDAFKYLLMTMESKNVNLGGILTELDVFFIGTSNEIHLEAFRQHPDFNSFKGRFTFIRVPYLLNANDEMQIYDPLLSSIQDHIAFEPHAMHTLAIWSVMTRIRKPQKKSYSNGQMGELASKLNPLEKALYLAGEGLPERFTSEERKLFRQFHSEFEKEYIHDNFYEGKFGISPRDIKQIINEITGENQDITFIEIQDYLNSFIERKNEHDFLNMAIQGDYHNPKKFIELLQEYNLEILDSEVRDSLGIVDNRSYEEYIARYVNNVKALLRNEKIKNPITGKSEPADMYFITEFENNIELKESPEEFRSNMISKLGAYYLDNPERNIVYIDVFSEVIKMLQESFRKEQKKLIERISRDLLFYLSELAETDPEKKKNPSLSKENRELIVQVIDNMQKKYRYSEKGAINLLRYLIDKKY